MKIIFSWDDGALEDQKLFELHEKYEIPGMFFVPTRNREGRQVLTPDMMRKAESDYVAFGGHTENHTYLTEIPIDKAKIEIVQNKQYLEYELGHEVRHFCFPGGRYNDEILELVYQCYATARTADSMNFSYRGGPLKPTLHFFPRGSRSLLGNALRNHSYRQAAYVAGHYDMPYFELLGELIKNEQARKESIVVIWGHSWELEQYQLWPQIQALMESEIVQKNKMPYIKAFELEK